ncbi:HAD family hydrolase [Rhizobium terrae]|uniref:HAD family hydrolase n=1 Tax=Rhizobium terrae TaxID=2171756 RepID=UPI0029BFB73E|nr:HAD family hydrolase [Rhizobium terrae]
MASKAQELRNEGVTVISMAADGVLARLFAIADPIKATTPEAVWQLVAEGIRVVMLTGDNETAAQAVARELGITEAKAGVFPKARARSSPAFDDPAVFGRHMEKGSMMMLVATTSARIRS